MCCGALRTRAPQSHLRREAKVKAGVPLEVVAASKGQQQQQQQKQQHAPKKVR
jgi:hypothetical protein